MYVQPRPSVIEYAGGPRAKRNNNSISVTSGSLKRKSSASMHDENITPPTTADTDSVDCNLPVRSHSKHEVQCTQKRKVLFLSHTSGHHEMHSPQTVEVYQTSPGSIKNYSRLRKTRHTNSNPASETDSFKVYRKSSNRSRYEKKRLTIDFDAPAELDATEPNSVPILNVFKPSKASPAKWAPLPVAVADIYQPRFVNVTNDCAEDVKTVSTGSPIQKQREKKRQHRHTTIDLAKHISSTPPRHTPLEPWVAEHRRKGTDEVTSDWAVDQIGETVDDMGTLGVIQKYFDSQTGGPVSPPRVLGRPYSLSPPTIPLPESPEPQLRSHKESIDVLRIDQSGFSDEIATMVPNQNDTQTTNPSTPDLTKSITLMDGDFAFAANGNYSPYDEEVEIPRGPKRKNSMNIKLGQVARAGSSYLGRLAPPILSHEALTASSHLGLNNLSNLLKQSGPRLENIKASTTRKKNSIKQFRVKSRKNSAARVGTAEGSPYRARRQGAASPACTREMTTLSGVKHLKIVIPTEGLSPHNTFPFMFPQSNRRRRSRQISLTFTEEMLNPLASPQIERIFSSVEPYYHRALSEPGLLRWRTPRKPPKSSKPVPVNKHPLASREDQTRARKLRDLQRIKKKPLSICTQAFRHSRALSSTSLKEIPASASRQSSHSGVFQDCNSIDHMDQDESLRNDSPVDKVTQLENRMILLEQQNNRLTDALAKVLGLSLQEGNLGTEEVLGVFRQALVLMRPLRE